MGQVEGTMAMTCRLRVSPGFGPHNRWLWFGRGSVVGQLGSAQALRMHDSQSHPVHRIEAGAQQCMGALPRSAAFAFAGSKGMSKRPRSAGWGALGLASGGSVVSAARFRPGIATSQ